MFNYIQTGIFSDLIFPNFSKLFTDFPFFLFYICDLITNIQKLCYQNFLLLITLKKQLI